MKYLLIFSILTFAFSNVYSQDHLNIKVDLVEVSFNSSLDFPALVDIKNQLSTLGISLDYNNLEFQENGKLKSISFSVDCHDGFKGSASATFTTQEKTIGFYRDYNENAKIPFGTGALKR